MTERDPQDVQAEREAEAAAQEAGGIGGRDPEGGDPARRPVDEAGGGVSEGFEQAEAELRENAEHGTAGPGDPALDAFTPEVDSDRSGAEYGEADGEGSDDRPDQG